MGWTLPSAGIQMRRTVCPQRVLWPTIRYAITFGAFRPTPPMSPELGRSALDALELMNVGIQFLREHVPPETRIHYAITDTGGKAPGVVQPYAEGLYLMRAPKLYQVKELYERVNKVAQGAAMMTETTVEIEFIKACSNTVLNTTLLKVMAKKSGRDTFRFL